MAVAVEEQTTTKLSRMDLLEALFQKDEENKALRKRVQYLEFLFSEKGEKFVSFYRQQKRHFKGMKDKILGIYFDDPTKGYSNKELTDEFSSRFPMISTVNLQRRTCELAEEGWFWKNFEEGKTLRFYLKLSKLVNEEEKGTKNQQLKIM